MSVYPSPYLTPSPFPPPTTPVALAVCFETCNSVACRSWCWTRRRPRWTQRQRHRLMTLFDRRSLTVHSSSSLTQCTQYCAVTGSSSSTPARSYHYFSLH